MGMEQVTVSAEKNLELVMYRDCGHRERLGIRNEYPETEATIGVFRSLALMYLVSPYLPEKITTDFFVPEVFRNLIREMYQCEGHEEPSFLLTDFTLAKQKEPRFTFEDMAEERKTVLTYSGGKDTLWNLDWLARERGLENILGVHIKRINKGVSTEELKASQRQHEQIGFPLEVVDLLNSSNNTGKKIMRARDMFIVGLAIPYAQKFGASQIFLEGGFYKDDSVKNEPFTCYESAWKIFNDTLKTLGIPVEAAWHDSDGMNAVKELAENRPNWLPLIHNCFSPEVYKPERRRKWNKVAPTFPLFESQCGSCVKCRELNIARIAFDPSIKTANPEDIRTYIKDTIRWTKEHRLDMEDFLAGAFSEQLSTLALKYRVEGKLD